MAELICTLQLRTYTTIESPVFSEEIGFGITYRGDFLKCRDYLICREITLMHHVLKWRPPTVEIKKLIICIYVIMDAPEKFFGFLHTSFTMENFRGFW